MADKQSPQGQVQDRAKVVAKQEHKVRYEAEKKAASRGEVARHVRR